MAVIAINLISNSITSAAISIAGKIMHKETKPLDQKGGSEVSLMIQKDIKKLLSIYENEPIKVKAIGISVPGIAFIKSGTVWAPNIAGWENYPLLDEVSKLVKGKNIRIKIGSNRTCLILGEHWQGAAKKSKNAIFFSVGNGVGAGILIDGKILHGYNDGVGAVGWMALERPYRDIYKETGFMETRTSWKGILQALEEQVRKTKNYRGVFLSRNINEVSVYELFHAYKQKDKAAVKVIKDTFELWGMVVANLVSMFNPEVFIFGGQVFGPAMEFIPELVNETYKWALPLNAQKVKFVGSQLGSNAGLFGAGQLATGKF